MNATENILAYKDSMKWFCIVRTVRKANTCPLSWSFCYAIVSYPSIKKH